MPKIAVIGSLNMDLIIQTPRMPVFGETILGNSFMTAPGGKGANQAVAASRLGGDVTMIGSVGKDIFGEELVKNLELSNVNTGKVSVVEGVPTGVAVIVLKNGNNFIIVDPGANYLLSEAHIDNADEVIKNSDIVMIQMEIQMETVEKAIDTARKNGVKVLLNPAPARRLSDGLLTKVDILTPNETESEIITGIPVKSVADAKKALRVLMKKGIAYTVITLGSNGAVYNRGEEIIHKTVRKVNAVDTTAAGDCFSAALAVSISEGKSIDEAVDFANAAGAITVTRKGAQTSLPVKREVEEYISQFLPK